MALSTFLSRWRPRSRAASLPLRLAVAITILMLTCGGASARRAGAAGNRSDQDPGTPIIADPVQAVGHLAEQAPGTPPPDGQVAGGEVPGPEEIAGFFDGRMDAALDEFRVPGAVVSVVNGGETVFAAGYGFADPEAGTPMDPDRSLVRIASVSKLFTFTAALQLVERGDLDLDADVNTYLTDFSVPATYPEPVTLRHLLTHTAGFEDRSIGTGARSAGDVPDLVDQLEDHQPDRVRPPGVISAYSNYGAGLAGYLVQEVSGERYEEYVARHLLEPLGMDRSTAEEPLPEALGDDLAVAYALDGDSLERRSFVYDRIVPDGSVSTTADDMTRFMLAHLGHGGLLEPETLELMHTRAFSAHPAIDGWTLGFKERTFNGHRVVMHDGSWQSFQSAMILVPGLDLGLFVSTTSDGGIDLLTEVVPAFFDELLPAGPGRDPVEVGSGTGPAAGEIAGFYRPTRSAEHTIEKLLTLLGAGRASVDPDGTLHFRGREWWPLGNAVYEDVENGDRLAAVRGDDGGLYLATDTTSFVRQPTTRTPPFNLVVVLVVVATGLVAVAGWPVAAGVRRLGDRGTVPGPAWRRARRLAGAGAGLSLLFLVCLTVIVAGDTGDFLYGAPLRIRLLLLLPVATVALLVAAVAATTVAWTRERWPWPGRVLHVVVLVGLALDVWFVSTWNLLGWKFG